MKKNIYFYAFCLIVTLMSCKKDGGATESETGYATGKVVDTQGKPLSDVAITIENTLTGTYVSYVGKTGADGTYKIKIGKVGTYHANAYLVKSYNGKSYRLPLHPDNDEVFSNAGAVRNFQWKLSGAMPEDGYYGAHIELIGELGMDIDEQSIEYTLTPVGKLIDGSDGKVLTLHTGQPNTPAYNKLTDIPIGRYTLAAVYVKNGQRQPLRLKYTLGSSGYQSGLTIDFPETWYEGVAVTYNY
ncbi:carboxypeptidase-like regulatory domain-containing protein [Niabella sp.]|uniref:carboxypeptidase-like regulatory domain-containing protein n=1 Tax=Niabella sp. TaxID=1962976 RepID=UPI0026030849|nr:carboxypeptidase-like regulatory domain-containing protein [Niabella sp.]